MNYNLKLILQSPKDFLYSFTYSSKKPVSIKPYDKTSLVTANMLMNKLKKAYPSMDLHLIGSVGLKIEGKGDIDLYATVHRKKISEARSAINKLFGRPLKTRPNFTEWNFIYESILVELKLTTPEDRNYLLQIRLFDLLKNNKKHLKEYVLLKQNLNNSPEKEYVRKRMKFFNRILSQKNVEIITTKKNAKMFL